MASSPGTASFQERTRPCLELETVEIALAQNGTRRSSDAPSQGTPARAGFAGAGPLGNEVEAAQRPERRRSERNEVGR